MDMDDEQPSSEDVVTRQSTTPFESLQEAQVPVADTMPPVIPGNMQVDDPHVDQEIEVIVTAPPQPKLPLPPAELEHEDNSTSSLTSSPPTTHSQTSSALTSPAYNILPLPSSAPVLVHSPYKSPVPHVLSDPEP
jgi:hypothetical protein